MKQQVDNDFRIPVLIRIEPGRFRDDLGPDTNFEQVLKTAKERGLRASLKSGNLLTGALFVDLDFIPMRNRGKGRKKLLVILCCRQSVVVWLKSNRKSCKHWIRLIICH